EGVRATRWLARDSLPDRGERGQSPGRDGLDLPAQHGEGPTLETPEHFGVEPLAPRATGQIRPLAHPTLALETGQGGLDHRWWQSQRPARLRRGEGAMRPGIPAHHVRHRVGDGLEEGLRDAGRQVDALGDTETGGVL